MLVTMSVLVLWVVQTTGKLTEYVVTRWYRAPELLCENEVYGTGVDVYVLCCTCSAVLCCHRRRHRRWCCRCLRMSRSGCDVMR